jgi:hypothetical protein
MLEGLTTRSIFDSEPDFLQRHSPMVVHAQHVDACLLQGAEQAPLTGRFVVVTFPIVLAVPDGLVLEELLRLQENAQVVIGDRLVSLLQFRTGCRLLRSLLLRLLNRAADISAETQHKKCRDESESERPFHLSYVFPFRIFEWRIS